MSLATKALTALSLAAERRPITLKVLSSLVVELLHPLGTSEAEPQALEVLTEAYRSASSALLQLTVGEGDLLLTAFEGVVAEMGGTSAASATGFGRPDGVDAVVNRYGSWAREPVS